MSYICNAKTNTFRLMKRIEYIDFAKGILIVLVVVDHVYWMINGSGTPKYEELYLWYNFRKWFQPWYMAAFFFLSGMVVNYNKPFISFLKRNIQTLIVPSISFSIICYSIENIKSVFTINFLYGLLDCLLSLGSYWFLISLFFAKIIMYVISKSSNIIKVLLCASMYVTSSIFTITKPYFNPLYLMQTLSLIPFLYIGEMYKKIPLRKKSKITITALSLVFIIVQLVFNFSLAGTRAKLVNYTFANFVPSFFYSLCIVLSFTFFCEKAKSTILEYIGKKSLVIYCMNIILIKCFAIVLNKLELFSNKLFAAALSLTFVICASLFITRCLDNKFTKWMIGK